MNPIRRTVMFRGALSAAFVMLFGLSGVALAQDLSLTRAEAGALLGRMRDASRKLKELANTRPPAALTPLQTDQYARDTGLLMDGAAALNAQIEMLEFEMKTTRARYEILKLQEMLQSQARKFTTMSNVAKARQNIALSAINNVR